MREVGELQVGKMVVILVLEVVGLVGLALDAPMLTWVLLGVPLVGVHHFLLLLSKHIGGRVVIGRGRGALGLGFGFLAHGKRSNRVMKGKIILKIGMNDFIKRLGFRGL